MTLPTIAVNVALGVPEPTDFIIEDPARGLIGSATFTIATGYSTVTPSSFGISIRRGRFARLWDSIDAGRCDIRLWNYDRSFDPSYLLSPYNRYITPGREVNIKANTIDLFTGFVDDWDLNYEVDGVSSATLKSTDALGALGQMQFDAWTSTGTNAQAKLTAVCERDEVGWSSAVQDFQPGVETLQSDSVTWGSSVLNYCQLIARSELGYLFASSAGLLTFRNRNVAVGATSVASFTDDGTGVPFQGIAAVLGSELLFARVGVDREGGTNQTASVADVAAWRNLYGPVRSLSVTGLLLSSDAQSLALAEYLLNMYGEPRYRVSELVVDITPLSGADQDTVLGIDITDTIDVTFTPDGVGDPIMQPLVVQGITHDISVERHVVTFSTIDAPFPFFLIDSADYGVIDTDIIGF